MLSHTASEYLIATQNRIILVCCILHNFVQLIKGSNADTWLDSEVDKEGDQDIQPAIVYPKGLISSKKMDKFRDTIAEKMWTQYQGYITKRDAI